MYEVVPGMWLAVDGSLLDEVLYLEVVGSKAEGYWIELNTIDEKFRSPQVETAEAASELLNIIVEYLNGRAANCS